MDQLTPVFYFPTNATKTESEETADQYSKDHRMFNDQSVDRSARNRNPKGIKENEKDFSGARNKRPRRKSVVESANAAKIEIMKTCVYSVHGYEIPFLSEAVTPNLELKTSEKRLSAETVQLAEGFDAISVFTSDDCSGTVIEKLHQQGIRFISLRSVGFDHVDLKKAEECGIAVANVPEYSPYSVAEHAVAMLMTLNRKFAQSRSLMKAQDFRLDGLTGFDVHEKTVGIIGTGKIGMAFAKIMNGFGTVLLGYDPLMNPDALALGVHYVSLEELLQRSDIVSVHCPLNERTKYLISQDQFAFIKQGCILINTSRGGIIDTRALIEAIENGRLGGACLDVYEKERGLFFEDLRNTPLKDELYLKLSEFENILITGHQGFLTAEALRGIAQITILNLDHWQRQEKSPNELTGVLHDETELVPTA